MSNSIACDDPSVKVIVGVDTHKHEHRPRELRAPTGAPCRRGQPLRPTQAAIQRQEPHALPCRQRPSVMAVATPASTDRAADSASNASTSPNRRAPSRLRSSRLPTAARSVQLVPRGARRSRSLRDSASTSPTTRCGCPQGYTLVTTCMITFFDDDTQPRCRVPSGMGVALLRRPFFRLFIGIFARGRFLFCSFCAGTELRTAPTRLFRAASPS